MAKNVQDVLSMITEHEVAFVDLRFTDPRGKWQHTAQTVSTVDEDMFEDGIMFDGSSIAGWKAIHESDMTLMPDPATAVLDPFAAQPSLILFCDAACCLVRSGGFGSVFPGGGGRATGRDR